MSRKIPLTELWDEKGALPGERIRQLDENLIRGLMGTGQVQFIVADCGAKLNWIPMPERFEFWKTVAHRSPTHRNPSIANSFLMKPHTPPRGGGETQGNDFFRNISV